MLHDRLPQKLATANNKCSFSRVAPESQGPGQLGWVAGSGLPGACRLDAGGLQAAMRPRLTLRWLTHVAVAAGLSSAPWGLATGLLRTWGWAPQSTWSRRGRGRQKPPLHAQGLPDLASHRLYSLGHTDQPDIMRERPIRLCETRMTGDSWSLAATA